MESDGAAGAFPNKRRRQNDSKSLEEESNDELPDTTWRSQEMGSESRQGRQGTGDVNFTDDMAVHSSVLRSSSSESKILREDPSPVVGTSASLLNPSSSQKQRNEALPLVNSPEHGRMPQVSQTSVSSSRDAELATRGRHHDENTRYIGVSWHKRDRIWTSRAWLRQNTHSIGTFQDRQMAALARDLITLDIKLQDATSVSPHPQARQRGNLKLNFQQPKERGELLDDAVESNANDLRTMISSLCASSLSSPHLKTLLKFFERKLDAKEQGQPFEEHRPPYHALEDPGTQTYFAPTSVQISPSSSSVVASNESMAVASQQRQQRSEMESSIPEQVENELQGIDSILQRQDDDQHRQG